MQVQGINRVIANKSDEFLPKIGLNRIFLKKINLNSYNETDLTTNKFNSSENIDPLIVEDILIKNSANLNIYKNLGGLVIYDDTQLIQKNYAITFPELLNVLSLDESSFESFIDKDKGTWLDNFEKNEIINEVQFESRFESGNLRMAIKISDNEYDLILKNDINSGKSYQWFFFQVKTIISKLKTNSISNQQLEINSNKYNQKEKIKFNIINCQKTDMLFSKGLRVLKYSEQSKIWSRDTNNIFYFINGLSVDDKKFYTLTFSVDIEDLVYDECGISTFYFSYCYPYTFSDLQNYFLKIMLKPKIESILRMETLGYSLSGNKLDMLIITDFESSFDEIAMRPSVILTSRVHPGESNSSFVIEGVIDYLLENDDISKDLRRKFIFKVIPMLNPDGVINGNFRNSLIGKDLNRMWIDPRENLCPSIFYTKEMIKKTLQSREVYLFCDFHGHSNRNNFFLYGCPTNKKNKPSANSFQEMILSRLFQSRNDYFDPTACIYKISPSKLKTARAVAKNEFGIEFSYCLESSIGYISIGENKNSFFTPEYYMRIGRDFCLSLHNLTDKNLFADTLIKIQLEEASKSINLCKEVSINDNVNNSQKEEKKRRKKIVGEKINKTALTNRINFNTFSQSKSIGKNKKKLAPLKIKTEKENRHLIAIEKFNILNIDDKKTNGKKIKPLKKPPSDSNLASQRTDLINSIITPKIVFKKVFSNSETKIIKNFDSLRENTK